MLPDFPSLKKRLHEKLYEFFLDRTDQYLGVVGRIPKHRRKEGGPGQLLIRHDGSTDASRAVELAVPFALEGDEIESITMDQLLAKVDRAALEMAKKQWGLFSERFESAVTEVGNAVDATGKTDVQAFFELLETVDLDFHADGSPDFPVIPQPKGREWFNRTQAKVFHEPDLREQYDQLIQRKKEEFRDREGNRKLVG